MGGREILASGDIRRTGLVALRFSEVLGHFRSFSDASDLMRSCYRFEAFGFVAFAPELDRKIWVASLGLSVVASE